MGRRLAIAIWESGYKIEFTEAIKMEVRCVLRLLSLTLFQSLLFGLKLQMTYCQCMLYVIILFCLLLPNLMSSSIFQVNDEFAKSLIISE